MKTIGEFIKDSRTKKRLSIEKLEKATKIKREFIQAIEQEQWQKLPERPVVSGFVKNIAQTLDADKNQALALFRRDYPPKSLVINPKPDVLKKFTWSPKLTFVAGVAVVAIVIMSYLGMQYIRFVTPPSLEVMQPAEEQVVRDKNLKVLGSTDPEVTVVVNNQPVLVEENGDFSTEVEVFEGTKEIMIVATSRSGKETVIRRKIIPELQQSE